MAVSYLLRPLAPAGQTHPDDLSIAICLRNAVGMMGFFTLRPALWSGAYPSAGSHPGWVGAGVTRRGLCVPGTTDKNPAWLLSDPCASQSPDIAAHQQTGEQAQEEKQLLQRSCYSRHPPLFAVLLLQPMPHTWRRRGSARLEEK